MADDAPGHLRTTTTELAFHARLRDGIAVTRVDRLAFVDRTFARVRIHLRPEMFAQTHERGVAALRGQIIQA